MQFPKGIKEPKADQSYSLPYDKTLFCNQPKIPKLKTGFNLQHALFLQGMYLNICNAQILQNLLLMYLDTAYFILR